MRLSLTNTLRRAGLEQREMVNLASLVLDDLVLSRAEHFDSRRRKSDIEPGGSCMESGKKAELTSSSIRHDMVTIRCFRMILGKQNRLL